MCAKCHAAGRIAASAGAEVLPWRYRPPRCGSSHGEFEEIGIPSAGTGRRRIRDPVLPPLPQRCPPRGHRARGRRSFGMDAGAECREQRQYIRCHRRGLSPGLFVVGFAHCMYSRTLHGPVYQTPGSLRTVRESLLPLSALLSPLSLSHCSPCAPRCRCCFAACPGREMRACLRVLCLPAALLAGMAEDTWLVAGGIGFSAGRARSL